ncbi:hypothetical protein Bhyg_05241 [Pseudolycoriella hygida]|uniref:Uncharacterized protein n=1 Tax=Pseudolycoriella hygida TaxID=35572 RepID=A0A9Q0NGW2_9DIPT|nr:hypothetical protein Bhyg_05241 [Pseudolycoriella hygida]
MIKDHSTENRNSDNKTSQTIDDEEHRLEESNCRSDNAAESETAQADEPQPINETPQTNEASLKNSANLTESDITTENEAIYTDDTQSLPLKQNRAIHVVQSLKPVVDSIIVSDEHVGSDQSNDVSDKTKDPSGVPIRNLRKRLCEANSRTAKKRKSKNFLALCLTMANLCTCTNCKCASFCPPCNPKAGCRIWRCPCTHDGFIMYPGNEPLNPPRPPSCPKCVSECDDLAIRCAYPYSQCTAEQVATYKCIETIPEDYPDGKLAKN